MFKFENKKIIRYFSLALTLTVLLSALVSCSSAPISSTEEELRSVGKVGDFDVTYEELYFLTNSYREGLVSKYGEYSTLDADTAEKFEDELRELVYENIISNHAILTLCASEGLVLGTEENAERVQKYIDTMIETNFGGSRSDYKKNLEEYGLTDHYVRFTAEVDLLYSDLLTKLLEEGRIVDDDAEVLDIIKSEFVRTWHIMIANNDGDDVEENRALAEEALSKYRDGSMKMYQLIGSKYNEDYTLTTLDGFYFTKGSMDEAYEAAAYALEVGEVSEVVESRGFDTNGDAVSCFYVIQRLELEDEYIEANFYELEEAYRDSVVYGMLEVVREELAFQPNEYGSSLTLATLEASRGYSLVSIILCVVGGIILVGGVTVLAVVLLKKKKNALVKK